MLHSRYFCSQSTNNLLKSINSIRGRHQVGVNSTNNNNNNNKRKQASSLSHLEVMNPNELVKRPRAMPQPSTISPTTSTPTTTNNPIMMSELFDYRAAIYQNYLRLFQQQQQQQPAMLNQARLREQLTSQLLAYFENNQNAYQQQLQLQQRLQEKKVEVLMSYNGTNESMLEPIVAGSGGVTPSPPPPSLSQPPTSSSVPPQPIKSSTLGELSSVLMSSEAIQNWCAKCNTYFRLTSDLVHHMRTLHRKDNRSNDTTTTSFRTASSLAESSSSSSLSSNHQRLVKSTGDFYFNLLLICLSKIFNWFYFYFR